MFVQNGVKITTKIRTNDTEDRNSPPTPKRSRRPLQATYPLEYPKLPTTNARKNNERKKELNRTPPQSEMEVFPLPHYQNQEANNNLFKERAEYNKRLSDLEKTLEDLRQESGHMKNLIESNKREI